MKYRDLQDGSLFSYSPQPGTHETAIRAQGMAYLLRTGETVKIHPNQTVENIPRLAGDGYRLGMLPDKQIVIYSQASPGYVFAHAFIIIGHAQLRADDVKPIVGKMELREQHDLVDIILRRLEQNAAGSQNLLKVLRDGLFQDFAQIKLT